MKPLPKILLALTAVAALSLFSVQLAQAYSVTLEQVGSDVVATGSGPLDLTGLTLVVTYASLPAQIFPVLGQIVTGSGGATDGYQGSISGPTSFGGVFFTFASSGSGDSVGIFRDTSTLLVPSGYVSGTALSDGAKWLRLWHCSIGQRDLQQRDFRQPRRNAWHLRMDVGRWSEPELHARDRGGWGARWRHNSFFARFRFARLDCLATQIGLLRQRSEAADHAPARIDQLRKNAHSMISITSR